MANFPVLCHANGASGSQAFVNEAATGPALVTIGPGPRVDTTKFKFGGGSIDMTAGSGCVQTAASLTFTGPFTVEFFVYVSGFTATFFSLGIDQTAGGFRMGRSVFDTFLATYNNGAGETTRFTDGSGLFGVGGNGVWNHVAISRDVSNNVRVYCDGTLVGAPFTLAGTFSGKLTIGDAIDSNNNPRTMNSGGNGQTFLDEIRVCSDQAIYTGSSFTVPTAEFSLAPAILSASVHQTVASDAQVATIATPIPRSLLVAQTDVQATTVARASVNLPFERNSRTLIVRPENRTRRIPKQDRWLAINSTGHRGTPAPFPPPHPLARFFKGGIASKVMTFWGDSTTLDILAQTQWDAITTDLILPDGELAGLTVINKGSNGQTMAGANATEAPGIYATKPDLVALCFGINSVRTGGVSAALLASQITTAVQGIQTNCPNADILLWGPNALASTDDTGVWILPVTSAQAYTDILYDTYEMLRGQFQHTIVVQKQDATGRISIPEPSLYMGDGLHPNAAGQMANLNAMLPFITPPKAPINLVDSAAAWAANPAAPWLVYPRALEDTRYAVQVCRFRFQLYLDLGSTILTNMGPRHDNVPLDFNDFKVAGRIIWTPSNGTYTLTGHEGIDQLGSNGAQLQGVTNANFLSGGAPPAPSNARLYQRI